MRDATPRPWIIHHDEYGYSIDAPIPNKDQGYTVCKLFEVEQAGDVTEHNAQLIVRAVNSYDAMREALEHCYKYMTGAVTAPSAVSCIKEAKAALAQQEVSYGRNDERIKSHS